MPKGNPTNPHATDRAAVERAAPMPAAKATVTAVNSRDADEKGTHRATIRVYGDPSPYEAIVLAPSHGDVNVPRPGDDVAVVFGPNEKPFIIGYWYAADKVEDGRADLPDYEPGERVIGTPLNDSYISIRKDGTISIRTDGNAAVDLDYSAFTAYLGSDDSVAGDNNYYKLQFDTIEDDPENMFDTSAHEATMIHDGRYTIGGTIEVAASGQNNIYTLAVFVNGSVAKRKSRQSVVNEPLSLDVELKSRFNEGDVVDIRLRQNSGTSRTVDGQKITSSFYGEREGV